MSPSRAPPPTAPALVNVFERCGASVTRSGKVSESVDKHLGRKALVVDGDVPAAHFVRLPKVGKPGLRLAGAYAYLQVRLDPARFYAAHIDLVCVDRARPTRSDASVDYQVGRKVVRVSVSNLYRTKAPASSSVRVGGFGAVSHHLQPPHAGWFCVRVDARASLRDALERGEVDGDAESLTFESIKSFQIGGAVAVRGVFVGAAPFDEESAPAETRASTKPDATLAWLDAGPVDEYYPDDEDEKRRSGETTETDAGAAQSLGALGNRKEDATRRARATGTDRPDEPTIATRVSASDVSDVSDLLQPDASARTDPSRRSRSETVADRRGTETPPRLRAETEDPALTLRSVIGASCETGASLSATRDGLVAYAADKATVIRSLDDPESPGQILLDHAEAVSCVAFSADGETLATAQKGAFPSVFVYRRAKPDSKSETARQSANFARVASLRASCASAVSLALASSESAFSTRLALLGDTPAGSVQTASLEVWDVPGFVAGAAPDADEKDANDDATSADAAPAKILFRVLKETTRATDIAFSPDRDDRLFACGDGFVTEATLAFDRASRSKTATAIEKPVCFADLDLAALRGDENASNETRGAFSFTTLAFLRENDAPTRLFVGAASGAVVSIAILDDADGGSGGNAACAPECAFQLHAGAVAAIAFFVADKTLPKSFSGASEDDGASHVALAATASADGTTRVWPADFSTAHALEAALDAPAAFPVAAAFARRKKRDGAGDTGVVVVTAASDGSVGSLDLSQKTYAHLTTSPGAGARAVTSLERLVCAACGDGAARGWDAVTGALAFTCAPPPGGNCDDVEDVSAATSVCFRPRRSDASARRGSKHETPSATPDHSYPEPDALAVGYASGAVRVFSVSRPPRENLSSPVRADGEGDPGESAPGSSPRETSLVAEILDAHAPGAAVDAVAFAGVCKPKLFSAARAGTLCAIEAESAFDATRVTSHLSETFAATRRVRVASPGARAAAAASPCGGYVLVAASAGALGASAATGGSRSSSHVLAFDADTLALKPPAMRIRRGGVAGIAAAIAARRGASSGDDGKDGEESAEEASAFSVFVAGDDAAAVLSRHAFPGNDVASLGSETNTGETSPLSASSLVRAAAEPAAVMRATHAPTALKETFGNAATERFAATLGVAAHLARRVVVTCGADGTVLVAPANAGCDPAESLDALALCRRFVGAHAGSVRGATFLEGSDPHDPQDPGAAPGDCLLATGGEGRVLCVWRARAAALAALEARAALSRGEPSPSLAGADSLSPSLTGADSASARAGKASGDLSSDEDETRARAFGLAPRGPLPLDASLPAARGAPASAGYARAGPEPWAERDPSRGARIAFPRAGDIDGDVRDGTLSDDDRGGAETRERRRDEKKNVFAAFPNRTVGVAVGAAAAAAERTENAAAVAAAAAAPGALYVPELGALAYAAGARVVIERMGGDKTQAVLAGSRGCLFEGDVTALARHADSRRLAASAPALSSDDDATIRVWDSGTGELLSTATHASCGGAVSVLAFSPSGKHLLSLGQDPEGAVRVFSLVGEDARGSEEAALVPVLALAAAAPVAAGAWLSNSAFFVVGAAGATAYRFAESVDADAADDETTRTTRADVRSFPFRFEDERGDALDPAPVCTAATALEGGGANRNVEAFAGDSRGRVWVAKTTRGDFGADSDADDGAIRRIAFRMVPGATGGAPLAALPRGEAATTMAAFADTTGRGVFVGSARRARVLFSERSPPVDGRSAFRASPEAKDEDAALDADLNATWYELGELELDGAVTSSHATTFVTNDSSDDSTRRVRHASKMVTATTSAGSAWAVDTRTGEAKALAHAHAVDVAGLTAFEDALATVTADGAARVWESASFAKALELFPESADAPRCVTSALCGERVCFARDDGTARAVDLAAVASKNFAAGGGRHRSDVAASVPYAFAAHPNGGAVVAAAFVESLREGAPNAQTPLVSVATDGSVAVTEFFPGDASAASAALEELDRFATSEDLRLPRGRAMTAMTTTRTTVVVPGGPGGVLPVRAAAFESGVFPARVAAARDDAVRVFSLRRTATRDAESPADDSGTPRFVASLTFEHAPVRAETFAEEAARHPSRAEVPSSSPGRSACVAWSAANAGVLYYAGAATGGRLLVLDAKRSRGDGRAAAEDRTSVVELPFPEPDDSCPHRARCVAVTNCRRAAGDLVAVGGDGGCVFFEMAARETAGFSLPPSSAVPYTALESEFSNLGDCRRETIAPTSVSVFASTKPVVSVDWRESRETKTAFLAAGADVYAFDDDALFREECC